MPEKDWPEHIQNVVPVAPMFAKNVGGNNLVGYVHITISTCVSEPFCSICGGLCGCLPIKYVVAKIQVGVCDDFNWLSFRS